MLTSLPLLALTLVSFSGPQGRDDAFPARLDAFLAACARHDATPAGSNRLALAERSEALGAALDKATTRQRAGELLAALRQAKPGSLAKPTLLRLLGRVGDPKVVTPYFLREIDGVPRPRFETRDSARYVAREYLVQSRDPRAVAFMIRQLRDPHADPTLREEAYVNMARTGGPQGVAAVRAARSRRALLRPLGERSDARIPNPGSCPVIERVVERRKDARGRTWGHAKYGVLGDREDLWLVEYVNGRWVRPLYTGASASAVAPVRKGAWFDDYVTDAGIRRDRDHDGLTDLAEFRLGTNPRKKDTDGDGDGDEVDPWPNAARRARTDDERVLAAVFEARFRENRSEVPALLIAPPGTTPFEMPGYRGPVLWKTDPRKDHPLEQGYGYGVALIEFYGDREASKPGPIVRWNADHTEARVGIAVRYGLQDGSGYEATVRKFGHDWIVTSLTGAFVS